MYMPSTDNKILSGTYQETVASETRETASLNWLQCIIYAFNKISKYWYTISCGRTLQRKDKSMNMYEWIYEFMIALL